MKPGSTLMEKRTQIFQAVFVMIINDKDQIAMIRRANTGYMDGMYTLPSGHIDEGEPATKAVIREAKEEVGASIAPKDLRFAYVFHRDSGDRIYVDFYFTANKWKGNLANIEKNKADKFGWFDLDKIPDNTIPYIKKAISHIRSDEYYGEDGWK